MFFEKHISWILPAIIVLFAGLTWFGITPFKPKKDILQLTVFVKDANGNVVLENEGELNTSLGHRSFNEQIGANGRTNFADITEQNKGKVFKIGLVAEGWEIIGNNEFVFVGKPIDLIVGRVKNLGVIKGDVRSLDGLPIGGALIDVNSDTIFKSDSLGRFKVLLPEKIRVRSKSETYLLTISKDGFEVKSQLSYPNLKTEVRLVKIK